MFLSSRSLGLKCGQQTIGLAWTLRSTATQPGARAHSLRHELTSRTANASDSSAPRAFVSCRTFHWCLHATMQPGSLLHCSVAKLRNSLVHLHKSGLISGGQIRQGPDMAGCEKQLSGATLISTVHVGLKTTYLHCFFIDRNNCYDHHQL